MAHIELPAGLPGIRGLLAYRPETAKPLNDLVDVLLRGPHTLSPGERELIATYVSAQNDCTYCQSIHGAVAARQLEGVAWSTSTRPPTTNASCASKGSRGRPEGRPLLFGLYWSASTSLLLPLPLLFPLLYLL